MEKNATWRGKGFTLLELLVVIAVVAILAALLFPVLQAAKQRAQGAYCMNNTKQMMLSVHIYTDDSDNWLPPNPDWPTSNMWVRGEMENPNDATNTSFLFNSKLAPYISGNTKIFKCPGDTSSHVRSYSMSQAVGTKPGQPISRVDGPWLDGTHHHMANHPWRTYGRLSDMIAPTPESLWVLMDENQYNINDAAFAVSMTLPTEFIDWPGTYHGSAGGITFADGHAEIHRWSDGRTRISKRVPGGPHLQNPNNSDMLWLQNHTSALN